MGLKYNEELVAQGMTRYVEENPEASEGQIENAMKELICREVVVAMWMDYYTRFPSENVDPMTIEADLRSGKHIGASRTMAFMNSKGSPEREEYLEQLQEMSLADTEGKLLPAFRDSVCANLTRGIMNHELEELTDKGDEYISGLFAPVPDSKGMLFEGLSENSVVTVGALREKQEEAEAVEIKIPEGMNAELVSYAVMGEFFKQKHLDALEKTIRSRGSTLPTTFSTTENSIATFLENTIISEKRGNMHACRLIVPEVRRSAKEIIESGNQDEIKGNLKSAFDIMFERAASMTDLDKVAYPFTVRNAAKLVDSLKKCGIEPGSLGITQDKLDLLASMQKIVDFKAETAKLRRSLTEKGEKLFFSGNLNGKDYVPDPDTRRQLTELAARDEIIDGIKNDLTNLHSFYDMYGLDDADKKMSGRTITEGERLLVTDGKGLLEGLVQKLEEAGEGEKTEKTQNAAERTRLFSSGIPVDKHVYEHHSNVPVFIEKIQNDYLGNLEEYAKGNPKGARVLKEIANVRKISAGVRPDASWQELDSLIPPYSALYKATQDLQNTIPPEKRMDKDNLNFGLAADRIRNLIQDIKKEPGHLAAQAESDKKRAALHESLKNDVLKYDHEKANERISSFKKDNPRATQEELKQAEINIVADEAICYARLAAYERCNPEGGDILFLNRMEEEIRSNNGTVAADRRNAERYTGEARLKFVAMLQNNLSKVHNEKELADFDNCVSKLLMANPEKERASIDSAGDGIFNALFAPKTNRSGIRMDNFDDKGVIKTADILEWQAETDAIEIPAPANMDKSLVSFLVLGRATQSDLLVKAFDKEMGPGSTIPKDFRKESNVQVSFWDNLMKNESRANMHCIRSVVPQARTEVRKMVLNGDEAGMKLCLKSAFDSMYGQVMGQADHTDSSWYIPMQKMGRFLEGLERSGIKPESLGIEPEKIEKYNTMKPILKLTKELSLVNAELQENMIRYFESGFDPAYAPMGDTGARRLLEKKSALKQVLYDTKWDVDNYRTLLNWKSINEVEDSLIAREPGRREKMIAEDSDAYVEMTGRKIKGTVDRTIKENGTRPSDIMNLYVNGVAPSRFVYQRHADVEKYTAGPRLEIFKGHLAKDMFNAVPGINEARMQLDELMELRNSAGENYTAEKLQSFAEPYRRMGKTLQNLYLSMPEEMQEHPDALEVENMANSFTPFIKSIDRDAESATGDEADIREFADIRKGIRPAFIDRYAAYRDTMEALGAGSGHITEYNWMKNSMDRLTNKLESMCGEGVDKNEILTHGDAQELKNLFTKALKDCTDYINVSGKNALSDDRVFMATELQSQLARNISFFDKLPETRELTLNNALKARYGEKVHDEDVTARFSSLADKLEEVGSRFGGNSEEFEKLKEALNAFKKDGIDPDKLKGLMDNLSKYAGAYVDAKKVVPSTEKGKRRLQIARETRDLCAEISEAKKWEYCGARQKDESTYEDKLKICLKDREASTITGMKKAVSDKNPAEFKRKFGELIYLKAVEKKLAADGDAAAEYLKKPAVEQGVAKLHGTVEEMLGSVSKKDLGRALTSPEAGDKLESIYKGFMSGAKEKGGVKADRSDNLISAKRPQL